MKIALVISSLGGGGAERVMATLANAWAASGTTVTLITLATSENDKYLLDPHVRRVALGVTDNSVNAITAIGNNVRRILALRAAIRDYRPDAVISFLDTTNALAILACTGLRIPVIVSDRVDVSACPPRGAWLWLYRLLYRRADAVVVQTRRNADAVARLTGCAVAVIPNPLRAAVAVGDPRAESCVELPVPGADNTRTLLAMGRLAAQKGFDLLLAAFAQVTDRHPDWQLVILGEGPERVRLAGLIAQHGLEDRARMPGFAAVPEQALRSADLFVLSSRFEGFPNALLEAMAEGLPCISYDCPTGPRELIEHGVDGWLVPSGDVEALATALDTLMNDAALRQSLGEHAVAVRDKYGLQAILGHWNAHLAAVIAGRNTASIGSDFEKTSDHKS